jgi:hypothetical protein
MKRLVIYKYPISSGKLDIWLPKQAKVLDVQEQRGEPQMWVLLDPDAVTVPRRFVAYGTGHPIEVKEGVGRGPQYQGGEWLDYIGTFQMQAGYLVYHLFEVRDEPTT